MGRAGRIATTMVTQIGKAGERSKAPRLVCELGQNEQQPVGVEHWEATCWDVLGCVGMNLDELESRVTTE